MKDDPGCKMKTMTVFFIIFVLLFTGFCVFGLIKFSNYAQNQQKHFRKDFELRQKQYDADTLHYNFQRKMYEAIK